MRLRGAAWALAFGGRYLGLFGNSWRPKWCHIPCFLAFEVILRDQHECNGCTPPLDSLQPSQADNPRLLNLTALISLVFFVWQPRDSPRTGSGPDPRDDDLAGMPRRAVRGGCRSGEECSLGTIPDLKPFDSRPGIPAKPWRPDSGPGRPGRPVMRELADQQCRSTAAGLHPKAAAHHRLTDSEAAVATKNGSTLSKLLAALPKRGSRSHTDSGSFALAILVRAGRHFCTLPTMPFVGQKLPEGSLQLLSRRQFGAHPGQQRARSIQ